MILGAIANFAGSSAATSCMKGVAMKSGYKIIDKVMIPVGIFIISSMVGDMCQDYTEKKVDEIKESIKEMKNIKESLNKAKNDICDDFTEEDVDEIVSNVFKERVTERDEDGNPIAGRYSMDKEEEENG